MSKFSLGSAINRRYQAWQQRQNEALFEQLVNAKSLKPTLTLSKVLAFLFALIVHATTLAWFILGVRFLVDTFQFFCNGIYAVLFLFLAWELRPRLGSLPKESLTRAEYPFLFSLLDKVAEAQHICHVETVVIDTRATASITRLGWRRTTVLRLGYPLWTILTAQERVALAAHELAHTVNGDVTRTLVVGLACDSLAAWRSLLTPTRRARYRRNLGDDFSVVVFAILRSVASAALFVLTRLLWRDSRRTEYLADSLASAIAGTEATVTMLAKLNLEAAFALMLHRLIVQSSHNPFQDLRQRARTISLDELQQMSGEQQERQDRLDVTHPPLALRMKLLESRETAAPQVCLSEADSSQIDCELAPLEAKFLGRA